MAVALAQMAMAQPAVTLTVQADKPVHKISPTLYGIFFEDINYGADGGLYAELVQNRSFEFKAPDQMFAWDKVDRDGAVSSLSVESANPLNKNNPHYLQLKLQVSGGGSGVSNSGFGGIAVKQGDKYLFSAYARVADGFASGKKERMLEARLESADGKLLGKCEVGEILKDWKKFSGVIESGATDANARLVVLARAAGTLDLDMISLFPEKTFKNRPNGMRADLAQILADMKPAFMRFPGGCIVEGKDLANAYRWKDTIGDVAERKTNWNRWQNAVKTLAPQYYQSYGLGFFEFFQLCEDIGAEPLPILNCGMACQYQSKELAPREQLKEYVQDALDLIEWANGPASSPWGAKRAAAGHPEPFHLKFLGIGNEQWGDEYFDRYKIFHEAIKAKYPDIQLITSAGPSSDGANFDLAWRRLKTQPSDIVDEHYYKPPKWFLTNTHRYDSYDRKATKVFAGEYAAHGNGKKNNLEAALAEAAFMTGLERNSDIVVMSSYAPLFAKIGSTQWTPDLIWCDNTKVYGTPSYYVQKLFSLNRGDVVLPLEIKDPIQTQTPVSSGRLFAAASKDEKSNQIIIKVVNPTGDAIETALKIGAAANLAPKADAIILTSAAPADENSMANPAKVAPVASAIDGIGAEFKYAFKPYSLTVLRIRAEGK